jgi:hypothetical protein
MSAFSTEQEDELLALEAILDKESLVINEDRRGGQISVMPESANPEIGFKIVNSIDQSSFVVSHLPPFLLEFE